MSKKSTHKKLGQKYQNTRTYTVCSRLATLTPQQQSIKDTEVTGLCKRCTEIIQWKIKYGKYKALSVPKKCLNCGMKSVTRAYFTICKECADDKGCCGKCQGDNAIGSFPESKDVKVKELNYLKEEMRYMKERERRKLVREMNKSSKGAVTKVTKPSERNAESSESSQSEDDLDIGGIDGSDKELSLDDL
ncbi:hypothetical protein LOD99_10353 [Oopsacas minuta]|uniref:Uncharacterized protein n=1 Tax=Oopsacas minuta TaxID=111878 RepID=A0AAV7KHU8_9METZ|nr:hypothetical protein LOD99_10353 [Oopsacas minuta]